MSKAAALLAFVALSLALSRCTCNRDRPDVSDVDVKLTVLRFDQDIQGIRRNYDSAYQVLDKRYGDFLPFYLKAIAQIIQQTDTAIARDTFVKFINDPYIRMLTDTVNARYADIGGVEAGLTDAFRYFKYYYPQKQVPTVVTYVFGPPYGFTYDTAYIGIGLDGYLGSTFPAYTMGAEPVPAYALRKFRREYIVPNTVNVWCGGMYDFSQVNKKLLDAMVYRGKVYYFMKRMLPDTPDSLVFGYSDSTMQWLDFNEPEVWKFFIKNKLLYETDPLVYNKYVNDAPGTSGMPPEAPGNIGSWVGYRIVRKYMEQHEDVTLPQLMSNPDAQKILTEARYKP